jgi:hypothetical protein
MFRAARCQIDFTLYVHESMAATVKRHDIWDVVYEESERIVLISPGTHRPLVAKDHTRHQNRWTGVSTTAFPNVAKGYRQGLRFTGIEQHMPMPLYGIMDVNPEIGDDESMLIRLPPIHHLPWIMPFRATAWTSSDLIAFMCQRMDSAIASGIAADAALAQIKVPQIYKDYLEPDQWKKFVTKYLPSAFSRREPTQERGAHPVP